MALAAAALVAMPAQAVVAGAGYTTNNPDADGPGTCLNGNPNATDPTVNCNLYDDKSHVWTNGGPSAGQNKLSAGTYFFAVLEPGGQNDSINDGGPQNLSDDYDAYTNRTFTVGANGKISSYAGTHDQSSFYDPPLGLMIRLAPYADTSNPGGVYILAMCRIDEPATDGYPAEPSQCKYDAFKVKQGEEKDFGTVEGLKYYDANANGRWDAGEPGIPNWPIDYQNGLAGTVLTDANGTFKLSLVADTYTFAEKQANAPWMQTGNTADQTTSSGGNSASLADKKYTVGVVDGGSTTGLNFGNVCVGAGGGLTLGFWSNKNGQSLFGADDLALMVALNLRHANGTEFNPGNYAAFRTWLLNATATNMAYMLSAQLAAMELNVLNGKVNGDSLIYAPGTNSANAAGFASVNDVMAEANTSLGTHGLTLSGDSERAYQEALKNALDNANNNLNFLQPGPNKCPTPVFPTS